MYKRVQIYTYEFVA